jgi:hypothetical protein
MAAADPYFSHIVVDTAWHPTPFACLDCWWWWQSYHSGWWWRKHCCCCGQDWTTNGRDWVRWWIVWTWTLPHRIAHNERHWASILLSKNAVDCLDHSWWPSSSDIWEKQYIVDSGRERMTDRPPQIVVGCCQLPVEIGVVVDCFLRRLETVATSKNSFLLPTPTTRKCHRGMEDDRESSCCYCFLLNIQSQSSPACYSGNDEYGI